MDDNQLQHRPDIPVARQTQPLHTHIFPPHAFEKPRDPDEVAPIVPTPNPVSRVADRQNRRADVPGFTPRPPVEGPTQIIGIQLALQRPASYLVRAATQLHNEQTLTASSNTTRNRAESAHTRNQQDAINTWLAQVVYDPPQRPYGRPRPPLNTPESERVDPELREYAYDYDYLDDKREG
ncbi:hypothetical protein EDB85DRAFT_1894285 [Lactarius pseudohatsudake]|nr:hypothetical protein EDB85DRAFT_1894285 [Lactarius pseudohatsudake]